MYVLYILFVNAYGRQLDFYLFKLARKFMEIFVSMEILLFKLLLTLL